ncbi:MAG: hypothetical protein WCB31_09405 [Nitrososphaeraceae archaeon]
MAAVCKQVFHYNYLNCKFTFFNCAAFTSPICLKIYSKEATSHIVAVCSVDVVILLPLLIVDSNGMIVIDESSVCRTHNNSRLKLKPMIQVPRRLLIS